MSADADLYDKQFKAVRPGGHPDSRPVRVAYRGENYSDTGRGGPASIFLRQAAHRLEESWNIKWWEIAPLSETSS